MNGGIIAYQPMHIQTISKLLKISHQFSLKTPTGKPRCFWQERQPKIDLTFFQKVVYYEHCNTGVLLSR